MKKLMMGLLAVGAMPNFIAGSRGMEGRPDFIELTVEAVHAEKLKVDAKLGMWGGDKAAARLYFHNDYSVPRLICRVRNVDGSYKDQLEERDEEKCSYLKHYMSLYLKAFADELSPLEYDRVEIREKNNVDKLVKTGRLNSKNMTPDEIKEIREVQISLEWGNPVSVIACCLSELNQKLEGRKVFVSSKKKEKLHGIVDQIEKTPIQFGE